MAITLYDISVANFLQTVTAVVGVLDKGLAFCREKGIDPETIVESRIVEDMRPFRFQIQQVALHSIGTIDSIKSGARRFPSERPQHDYAGLQKLIAETLDALKKLSPSEVNSYEGKEVALETGETNRVFTAEGFVLSFALPNFYFHTTTAYDILRGKGVPLGKRDYMGAVRLKS
jgi:hypothetical protein